MTLTTEQLIKEFGTADPTLRKFRIWFCLGHNPKWFWNYFLNNTETSIKTLRKLCAPVLQRIIQ